MRSRTMRSGSSVSAILLARREPLRCHNLRAGGCRSAPASIALVLNNEDARADRGGAGARRGGGHGVHLRGQLSHGVGGTASGP